MWHYMLLPLHHKGSVIVLPQDHCTAKMYFRSASKNGRLARRSYI